MGAGVVARKLTFSNKVSELLDGAVTSYAAGLSRTVYVGAFVYFKFSHNFSDYDMKCEKPENKRTFFEFQEV